MFETVSEHAQTKGMDFRNGLSVRLPEDKNAWQLKDFGYPATVFFPLRFNGKFHSSAFSLSTIQVIVRTFVL